MRLLIFFLIGFGVLGLIVNIYRLFAINKHNPYGILRYGKFSYYESCIDQLSIALTVLAGSALFLTLLSL